MYLARFAHPDADLVTTAFQWAKADGPLLSRRWTDLLLGQSVCDLALRLEVDASGRNLLLFLSADARGEAQLCELCGHLLQADPPSGLAVPATAQEFDRLTGGMPSPQIRVNHQGFHHGGMALACDFRLYAMLAGPCCATPTFYQVHLRPHTPDRETERRVRKYQAWLEIENPFSDPVRAMQRMLSGRLRQRGFLAGEYLTTQDPQGLGKWQDRIRTHFDQTTGQIGFPQAPIETGDFDEILAIGCHPARYEDANLELPAWAASVFGEDETASLLASDLGLGRRDEAVGGRARPRPDVFISYASCDYQQAAATCRHLEENGVICWIAPRDINRDVLPYSEAIQRGIQGARAVVVFLSDAANVSVHIPRELDLALERKLVILPVRLSDVTPAGQLNYLLRTCQWLNAYGREFPAAMEELVGRLGRLLGHC